MRYFEFALLVVLVLLIAGPNGVSGVTAGFPDSMASLGDSITRATNPGPALFGDHPQYSWSTGEDSTVQSHYYRILQQNSLIAGNNYNFAVSGAQMIDLNGQATNAVSQGVERVTILMGANDVCTSSEGTMTSVSTFRTQFQTAMNTLAPGLPSADILVASIPDIYNLWAILKDNSSAVSLWNGFNICQSMLANPTSTAPADVDRRDRVRQRNIDFNTVLGEECAFYTNCRFDDNALFNSQFVPGDVSTLDYFHPSIVGQTKLAAGAWDSDGDGAVDAVDNCLTVANGSNEAAIPGVGNQTNSDFDLNAAGATVNGLALPSDPDGDACDEDDDNDSFNGVSVLTQTPGAAAVTCPGGSVPVWADCVEVYLGTTLGDNCNGAPGAGGGAFPPDVDGSGTVSAGDVFAVFPSWLTATARHDLDASGTVSAGDVFAIFPWWLVSCT